jgi:hypothetical protein
LRNERPGSENSPGGGDGAGGNQEEVAARNIGADLPQESVQPSRPATATCRNIAMPSASDGKADIWRECSISLFIEDI